MNIINSCMHTCAHTSDNCCVHYKLAGRRRKQMNGMSVAGSNPWEPWKCWNQITSHPRVHRVRHFNHSVVTPIIAVL